MQQGQRLWSSRGQIESFLLKKLRRLEIHYAFQVSLLDFYGLSDLMASDGKKPGFNVHSRLKRTSDCDVTLVAKRLLSPQISPLTHFDGFIPTVATFLSA